jgi:hypothetical protein
MPGRPSGYETFLRMQGTPRRSNMEILKFLITGCPNERTLLYSLGNKEHPSRFCISAPRGIGVDNHVQLRELVATDHPQVWVWGGYTFVEFWPQVKCQAWGLCNVHHRTGVYFVKVPDEVPEFPWAIQEARESCYRHLHDDELRIPEVNVSVRKVDLCALADYRERIDAPTKPVLRLGVVDQGQDPVEIQLDIVEEVHGKWVFRGTAAMPNDDWRVISGSVDSRGWVSLADSSAGYELPYFALSRLTEMHSL